MADATTSAAAGPSGETGPDAASPGPAAAAVEGGAQQQQQQQQPVTGEDGAGGDSLLEPRKPTPPTVIVQFKHAAGAPQLKKEKSRLKCKTTNSFRVVIEHLRKLLRTDKSVFLYVSSNHIAPSPDQTLANLASLFGRTTAKGLCVLEIDYAVTQAWG